MFATLWVGCVVTLSGLNHFTALLCFFLTSSKLTKWRKEIKRRFEPDFKEGGQRNWAQVLCNGFIPTVLLSVYILEVGCTEKPLNFTSAFSESWLSLAAMSAIACCNGDTWASEIGSVVGSADGYRLITTLQKVPRGTNSGVSLVGTFASAAGGVVVGAAYYLALVSTQSYSVLRTAVPQWPAVPVAGLAGLLGSLIDSVLGATLQFSGKRADSHVILETSGSGVMHISGIQLLNNHAVNFVSSLITAFLIPYLVIPYWPH